MKIIKEKEPTRFESFEFETYPPLIATRDACAKVREQLSGEQSELSSLRSKQSRLKADFAESQRNFYRKLAQSSIPAGDLEPQEMVVMRKELDADLQRLSVKELQTQARIELLSEKVAAAAAEIPAVEEEAKRLVQMNRTRKTAKLAVEMKAGLDLALEREFELRNFLGRTNIFTIAVVESDNPWSEFSRWHKELFSPAVDRLTKEVEAFDAEERAAEKVAV